MEGMGGDPGSTEVGREAAAVSTPAPGWYFDPTGSLRWWDGTAWGPAAPVPVPSVEDAGKAMSVLSWLGFFVMYFVVALAVRLIERDGNRFARWHASEALNLQLTFVLLWNLVLGPVVIITMVTSIGSESQGPPAAFFLMLPVAGTLFITCAAGCIYGAVRAGRGDWWRCQFAIPFLRAHRRELDRVSAGNSDHAGPR